MKNHDLSRKLKYLPANITRNRHPKFGAPVDRRSVRHSAAKNSRPRTLFRYHSFVQHFKDFTTVLMFTSSSKYKHSALMTSARHWPGTGWPAVRSPSPARRSHRPHYRIRPPCTVKWTFPQTLVSYMFVRSRLRYCHWSADKLSQNHHKMIAAQVRMLQWFNKAELKAETVTAGWGQPAEERVDRRSLQCHGIHYQETLITNRRSLCT